MIIVRPTLKDEWSQLARLDAEFASKEDRDSLLLENPAREAIVTLLAEKLRGIEHASSRLPAIGSRIGRLTAGNVDSLRVRVIELRSLHQALIHHLVFNDDSRAAMVNPSNSYLKDLQLRLENIDFMMAEARLAAQRDSSSGVNSDPDSEQVSSNRSINTDRYHKSRLGTLSHNVRTPLQAAKLRTELLAMDVADRAKESEELQGVLKSLDEAIGILNKYTLNPR